MWQLINSIWAPPAAPKLADKKEAEPQPVEAASGEAPPSTPSRGDEPPPMSPPPSGGFTLKKTKVTSETKQQTEYLHIDPETGEATAASVEQVVSKTLYTHGGSTFQWCRASPDAAASALRAQEALEEQQQQGARELATGVAGDVLIEDTIAPGILPQQPPSQTALKDRVLPPPEAAEAAAAQTPSPATDRDRMPPPPVLDAQADGGTDGEAESEDESEAETEAAEELPQADDPMELDGAEEAEESDDESAAAADHEPEDDNAMAESAPPRQLDPETRSESRRRPSAGATWLAERRACAQIGWCAGTTRSWRARPA